VQPKEFEPKESDFKNPQFRVGQDVRVSHKSPLKEVSTNDFERTPVQQPKAYQPKAQPTGGQENDSYVLGDVKHRLAQMQKNKQ